MTEPVDRRQAGMAKMQEVYGLSVDPADVPGPYVDMTVDHLFGTVWAGEALDVRDRRLLIIGVLPPSARTICSTFNSMPPSNATNSRWSSCGSWWYI
jgi:hypothetical protein